MIYLMTPLLIVILIFSLAYMLGMWLDDRSDERREMED